MNTIADSFTDILIKIVGDASQYVDTVNNVKNKSKDLSKSVSTDSKNTGKNITTSNNKAATSYGHLIDFEKSSKNQLGDLSTEISNQGGRWNQLSSRMINAVQPMNQKIYETGNKVKQTGEKIQKSLGTEAALAFAAAGAAALSFSKQCISSAISAESAWARFGGLVDSNGGDWANNKKDIKDWAVNFSTQMGYATADTRTAASNLLMYGMSMDNVMEGMKGVAALAARAGITEAEASNVIIGALNGRGRALRRYTGLEVKNYKLADGTYDKMKLLSDIYEKSADALNAHANTTEANIQRITNMWNSFKTSIGNALMPVVKIIADVVTVIVKAFKSLPDPIKTVIATFLLVGGAIATVIGVLGLIAPGLIGLGTLMMSFSEMGGIVGIFLSIGESLKLFLTTLASSFVELAGLMVTPWGLAIIAIVAVVAILWHLYNTNEDVRNSLNNLGSVISGVLHNAWNNLVQGASQVWSYLQQLGSIITAKLVPAWNELAKEAMPLYDAFVKLGSTLNDLWIALNGGEGNINGASNSFSLLGFIAKVVGAYIIGLATNIIFLVRTAMAILIPIITFVVNQLSAWITAGTGVLNVINDLVNGNISFGEALGRIGEIIGTLGNDISANLAQLFNDVVSNLGGIFDSLPQTVQEELGHIAEAFLNASPILSAIISLGTQIVDFFKSILGIASPGFMAQAIQDEMGHIADFISGAIGNIIGAIVQLGLGMLNAFLSIPSMLAGQFMLIVGVISTWLGQARIQAINIISSMVSGLVLRVSLFIAQIRLFFTNFVNIVRARFSQARTVASTLVTAMRTAIVTKVQNIVSRVQSFFSRIPTVIRSRLASAVSTARQKAQEIYNNIKNKIQAIPQAVADEMGKIPGKIQSALASAASAALRGAANIVSSFLSGLQRHSPGKVQRETDAEFYSLPKIISDSGILAAKNAGISARNIVKSWEDNFGNGLKVPEISYSDLKDNLVETIGDFDALSLKNLINDNYKLSTDISVLGTDLQKQSLNKTNPQLINNNTVNEGSSRTIIIQQMDNHMEMGNLNTAQSRKVLYNALDGLYDGVIGNG